MNNLTQKEEKFAQNIAGGMSQYDSLLDAYPTSKKWTRQAQDVKASLLANKPKIRVRIKELKKPSEDLLEKYRTDIIQKAIDLSLGMDKDKVETVILNKLLDKLLATKTENKNEISGQLTLIDLIKKRR